MDNPADSPKHHPTLVSPSREPAAPAVVILTALDNRAPMTWLRLGWRDFRRCPHIGLFYGSCFFLMGQALWHVLHNAPAYVLGLSAGFLLLGPFLCLGLYEASRSLEVGQTPSLRQSLLAWRPTLSSMAIFATVLLIIEMLWGRASLVVFAVTMKSMPATDKLIAALMQADNVDFLLTYLSVATLFGSLIFLSSAISIPMILDRQTDAISAALTSFRACLKNPWVMLLWGLIIALLTLAAMLPAFVGLLIVAPVLGHATWHAYRHIAPR